jgi:dolichol-phosphate mannosyltransferase
MTSSMSAQAANDAVPEVSLVTPVFNEEAAAPALAREIAAAFAGRDIEIIFVDDASQDGTRQALLALKPELPGLRVLWHGRNAGQSRAIRTGVLAARAPIVVTLDDGAVDTGCGLKAFRREVFLRLPYFDHMHRYLPALVLREGYGTAFQPVGHRPRLSGHSKYTNLGRLLAALPDLCGVLWLRGRARHAGPLGEG